MKKCGPENYFKGLTQATFEPETDRLIWELMEEKGLELEKASSWISDISKYYR